MNPAYRGRFAPSPTGPLHLGSLFAAVISFLDAKAHSGQWLVRIEDLDPPREQAGAAEDILRTLECHGLYWDDSVIYQSQRAALYEDTLDVLAQGAHSYCCPCSRKYLLRHGGQHSAACRAQALAGTEYAIKFRCGDTPLIWHDGYQGVQRRSAIEDFVLKRKEGFYAYQLAVVCDDLDQGVSHVVRGYDLLDSTPMQLLLYDALALRPPAFSHFPVIVSEQGQKLSKQNLAPGIDKKNARENLRHVFKLIGFDFLTMPDSPEEALDIALSAWKTKFPPVLRLSECNQ